MAEARPELSVVIPCSRPDSVPDSLKGLAAQTEGREIEAFVVGRLPEPLPGASRFPFPVDWIATEQTHPNHRRNLGIERCRARRIAMLDDDAVPLQGWLDAALSLPEQGMVIRTGPESPARQSAGARLVHAVYSSPVGEVSSGHHTSRAKGVAWYQVPFSNFLTTRELLDAYGPLDEDIPWDMDDFDLCFRARKTAAFEADPRLRVSHDRYPDSPRDFLRYMARLRLRTGVKLVTHPRVYWRVPAVAACACFPWTAAVCIALEPMLAPAGLGAYAVLLACQLPRAAGTVGLRRAGRYLALATAVHATTLACVQVGILKGLAGLPGRGRRDAAQRRA